MKRNMHRVTSVALLLLAGPAGAGELGVGDAAPALEVTKWVKGGPLDLAKAKGHQIVVLEFWATWCGPCVHAIPHLTQMQQKYADQGVVTVGVTSKDPDNALDKVEEFVKKQGAKMHYAIAFDETEKASKAYMEASGQMGIPTAFVIDKEGRVAWIGHPEDGLDGVLAELVAGKYDLELAKKKYALGKKINDAMMMGDFEQVAKLADEYLALDRHALAAWNAKLMAYMLGSDQPEKALATARQAVEVFAERPEQLAELARALVPPPMEDLAEEKPAAPPHEKEFKELALAAVTRAVKLAPASSDARSAQYLVLAAVGRDDEALTVAHEVVGLLKDNPAELSAFAMVLSRPDPKHRCNDLALKAIELAQAAEPDEPAHLQAKFHVLAACKQDLKAAEQIGRYLIEKAAGDAGRLNEFAWTLLTEEPLAGKFNSLALAAAERCHQVSGGTNWMYLDTLALAKFETGDAAAAIELEKKAIELCPSDASKPALQEALARFEAGKK